MTTQAGGAKTGMKSRMSVERKITRYHIPHTFARFGGKHHQLNGNNTPARLHSAEYDVRYRRS